MTEYFKLLRNEKSYLKLLKEAAEPKVKIPVKHPGVLNVPEGKNVEDLPYEHFAALAKTKGFGEISKALTNLHTWNKDKNPTLASWADKMQEKLSKEFSEAANEAVEMKDDEKEDEKEVEEISIHQPERPQGGFGSIAGRPSGGSQGGFGSIGGKSTQGGFGSIAGRPQK